MNADFGKYRGIRLPFVCIILSIICIFNANAQEQTEEQENTGVSVYIHPLSLLVNNYAPYAMAIYSTVEIPFSLSNSLIIKPSFLKDKLEDRSVFRLGSDIGIRHYLSGKGKGFYLQGQIGAFYYKFNRDECPYDSDDVFEHGECPDSYTFILPFPGIPIKHLWFDVMGYFGYSLKLSYISIFADVGIGVVTGIHNRQGSLSFYPLPDINIGLRVPLGVGKPANEQEDPEQKNNAKVYVYLHPASLLFGILSEEADPIWLMLYSTIEIPFRLDKSLIIKPSFVKDLSESRQFRAGGDIGMRTYNSKKGEGFYWQKQIGVFYHDAFNLFPEIKAGSSIWLDIMGYIGYSWKFSHAVVFADAGLGVGRLFSLEQGSKGTGRFFMFPDINLGVGIPF